MGGSNTTSDVGNDITRLVKKFDLMNENLNKTNSDNVFIISEKTKRLCTRNLVQGVPGTKISPEKTGMPHLGPFSQQAGSYYFKGFIHIDKKECLGAVSRRSERNDRRPCFRYSVRRYCFCSRVLTACGADLIKVSIPRKNLIPILADANILPRIRIWSLRLI